MIEKIDRTEDFEKLRPEWNELLQASASDCFFLSWEWLFTWWRHFSRGSKLSILAVRSGGELIALAPLILTPARFGMLEPFRTLEFIGSGAVGSDYLDFIVRRGKEDEALRTLAEYLAHTTQTLRLDHLNRNTCAAAGLARILTGRGWGLHEAIRSVSPFIALAGHSWDSYLATLGAEHRYNFKRRLKNLTKQFAVRFEMAGTEQQRGEAFALLVRLHTERWKQNGARGVFQRPGLLPFHREMTRIALERGWLRLFLLWLGGTPAAALYGFRYGRVFYFFQSGFDPAYGKFSVGLVAMGLAIKSAVEEGAEEYDLLYGDEPYKFLWTRHARELGRLEIYPPSRIGRFHRQALEFNRALRKTARRVLTQPT